MTRLHSEKGAALVEMAIVTPVLLLIFAGIAEFGFLFRTFEVTTNAAREGARLAALPGNEENAYDIVTDRVRDYLLDAGLTAFAPDQGGFTVAAAPESIALGALSANGARVTVTYTYRCRLLGPAAVLMNGSFTNEITFQSIAVMRTEIAAVGP
jgi:Flp pilus assembly protein TadG